MRYRYLDIQEKDISVLKELWEKNRVYHEKTTITKDKKPKKAGCYGNIKIYG